MSKQSTENQIQYIHRRLQRSVNEMRKYVWTRPNVSVIASFVCKDNEEKMVFVSNYHPTGIETMPSNKKKILTFSVDDKRFCCVDFTDWPTGGNCSAVLVDSSRFGNNVNRCNEHLFDFNTNELRRCTSTLRTLRRNIFRNFIYSFNVDE